MLNIAREFGSSSRTNGHSNNRGVSPDDRQEHVTNALHDLSIQTTGILTQPDDVPVLSHSAPSQIGTVPSQTGGEPSQIDGLPNQTYGVPGQTSASSDLDRQPIHSDFEMGDKPNGPRIRGGGIVEEQDGRGNGSYRGPRFHLSSLRRRLGMALRRGPRGRH